MVKKSLDLNTCGVFKGILKLGVPAVITALFDEINGVVDTIFMGQFLGESAVASMSIVMPFLVFASALAFLFCEGASISIGRYLGAEDYENSSKTASLTIKATLAASIILGIICFSFAKTMVGLFHLDAQTAMYSVKYIRYFSLGLPLFMSSFLFIKFLYTEGFSGQTLRLTIIQVAANIILNWIFLGFFGWGVEGAVAGTLISFLLQAVLAATFLIKRSNHIKIKNVKFDKAYFKEIVPLGLPSFFTMILLAVTITIQSKIISGFGSSALGVQTIFENIFSVFSSISTGIMNAALVLMAYSTGAGNRKRFMETLKKSAVIVFITSVIINLPLVFCPDIVGLVFTESANILDKLKIPMLILGLTSPFIFTTNTILFAMQPIGMEKTSTLIFALQQLVLFVPLILILKNYGFNQTMAAQPSAEVIGGFITLAIIPVFMKTVKKRFANSTHGEE
ncbi:MAG: MATE family efflux transporter [Spirochaetales bacterium]|nr:MATE family efflux transporter [Spirochaetales bacterium]